MKLQFELDETTRRERAQRIEILKKNPLVSNFLEKNGLDASFLEKNSSYFEDWVESIRKCSGCQGMEFCVQKIPGKVKNIYMDGSGFLEERYQSCKYHKKFEDQIAHQRYYRLSHLSKADYSIDLHAIDLSKETNEYVMGYTKVVVSLEKEKGVYLYGQPGVGKSYLMAGVANYYAKKQHKVSFVRVPLLVQDLKQSMFDAEYRQDVLGDLRFSEILILDDIGSESITAWTRDEILFPVLDYRMNHGMKTYFTSNYTLEELEAQYCLKDKENGKVASLRLMERVRTLADSVSLLGKSRR